jgi:cell division protein FtsL
MKDDLKQIFWTIQDISPIGKIFGGIALLLIILAIITASSLVSARWQSARFERESQSRTSEAWAAEQRAQEFERNALRYKAQNDLLRVQNEAQAEILKANDRKLEGDATKLVEILKERRETSERISQSIDDADHQRCSLCADARSAGFRLSAELCANCSDFR